MKTYNPAQCASTSGGGGGLPPGGAVNDLLTKLSSADGDVDWKPLDQQPSFISLEARVTVNEGAIAQNQTDIGQNATDIATNASNIASNDTDIVNLQTNKENKSEKGAASGYAPLDAGSLVPDANLPSDLERTGNKGAPSGYAPLGADSIVPSEYLPSSGGGLETIPQSKSVYVDALLGDDSAVTNRGNIDLPYATIAAALSYVTGQTPTADNTWVVRVQPGIYIEGQLIVPSYSSIEGIDDQTAEIFPSGDTTELISLSTFASLRKLKISGDINNTGSGFLTNPTVLIPSANNNIIEDCRIIESSTGIQISDGAGLESDIIVSNCVISATTNCLYVLLNASLLLRLSYLSGGTGLKCQDNAVNRINNTIFKDVTINLEQIGNSTVALNGNDVQPDKAIVSNWENITGFSLTELAMWVVSNLSIGIAERGRKAIVGEGASYTRGMLVYEYNINTDTFTDVTEAAKESGPPDVGIPTVDSGSALYIGTQLVDSNTSLPVDFSGLFGQLSQQLILGDGDIRFQVWDGTGWDDIDGMMSQATAPYGYLRFDEAQAGNDYNTRLSDILTSIWVRNDPIVPPIGTDLYWIRLVVADNWYNDNWEYRIKLTVLASNVQLNTHDNMPLQINLANITDTQFWDNIQPLGQDIRITDSTGRNLIPQELVWIDTVAKTGELYFNSVVMSNVDDNVFYMYWGNPIADPVSDLAGNGKYNVWLRYDAVFHFQVGPQIWQDSTIGGYDATNRSATSMTLNSPGLFGNDTKTDGADTAGAALPDIAIFKQPGAIASWEVYCQLGVVESGRIVSLGNVKNKTQDHDYFGMMFDAVNISDFSINGERYTGINQDPISQGVPHQFALQYDAPIGTHWIDGVTNGSIDDGLTEIMTDTLGPFMIGNRGSNPGAYWFQGAGSIDEYRVSREAFLAGWYETTGMNMLDQSNFYTMSAVENKDAGDFEGAIPITQPPRWNQIKLYPDCFVMNKDGFLEYFGRSRAIVANDTVVGMFTETAGTETAGQGGEIWVGPDFGVQANFRFPPSVDRRISTIAVESNTVDTSCFGRLRIHFITRNSDAAGDILFKIVGYETPPGLKFGTSEAEAGLNPENTSETFVIVNVASGTQDEEGFANAVFDFPNRSTETPFSQKGNLLFYSVERLGSSQNDTYPGDVDLIMLRAYHTKWREGSHTGLF